MTGWKKNLCSLPYETKKSMIEFWNKEISISKQALILNISRSFLYYKNVGNEKEEKLMEEIDIIYTLYPFYWARRIKKELELKGYSETTRYEISKLMRIMWIEAVYPKRKTSIANKENTVYPYLLRNVSIIKVNQVWSTDITYIRLSKWWIYLIAVIDWYSRKIISWKLSNTMDINFCTECLREALQYGKPEIFNTDQWSQFTSNKFTSILKENWIQISMDWIWRCLDNVYIERFWRSLKYENVYMKKYENMFEAQKWIEEYIEFYNKNRIHQSLEYSYPEKIWLDWLLN